jgi:hypothetical protein
MAVDKEEFDEFNNIISNLVLFYKVIWDEIEKQFKEIPQEEKHKIFGIIAPSIVGMLNLRDEPDSIEYDQQPKTRRKR